MADKNITTVNEISSVDNSDKVFVNDGNTLKQITVINLMKKAPASSGGGTTDYNDLTNQPQLNGVTLEGNKTLDQVGVLAKNQGSGNSGKYLSVGSDGNVVPADAPSGGTVDPEQIKQAVNGYLEENPVSGMTAEQEQQLNQNTEDVSDLKSALDQKITINRIDGVEGKFKPAVVNLASKENMNNYVAGYGGEQVYVGSSYSYTIEVNPEKNYIIEFDGKFPDNGISDPNYKWICEKNSQTLIRLKFFSNAFDENEKYYDGSKTYFKYVPSENTNEAIITVMVKDFDIRNGFGIYERNSFLPEDDGFYYIDKMFGLPFKSIDSNFGNTHYDELKMFMGAFNPENVETYRDGTDGDYWEYKGEEIIVVDCKIIEPNSYVYLHDLSFESIKIPKTLNYPDPDNLTYDICIIGAGAGGIGAAYALKESGYKICIIDKNFELGGTHLCAGVNGCLSSPILGDWFMQLCKDGISAGKVTIGDKESGEGTTFEKKYLASFITTSRNATGWGNTITIEESWAKKRYYDDLSGDIDIFLNTEFIRSYELDGVVYAVDARNIVTNKIIKISASYFLDCSGDGVLCRYGKEEGVDYYIGSDERNTYNENAYSEEYKKNRYAINEYEQCYYAVTTHTSEYGNQTRDIDTSKRKIFSDIETACNSISQKNNFVTFVSPGRYMNAPKKHLIDLGADNIREMMKQRAFDHWEKYKIKALKTQTVLDKYFPMLAIRETYRIKCDKMLTQIDSEHKITSDEITEKHIIAISSWWCDMHASESGINTGSVNDSFLNGIPYESIIPSAFKNVLIASRCFGTSHIASASYRLNKTIMSLGYVAGLAMKICRKNWLDDVRNVNITELQNNCGIKELFELVNSIS